MREYGPGHPLVFNHIPKSAGTSLRVALEMALKPESAIYGVDLSLVGGYDAFDGLSNSVRSTFYFSPDELAQDATLITGHISPGTTMNRYPGADHFTTLRNPRLRVISQWLYSKSFSEFDLRHWGDLGEAFRVGRGMLSDYLEHEMIAPNVDNTITRFLVWPHPLLGPTTFIDERDDDELFASAIDRLDRFAYVGVIENPAFLSQLSAWLGRPLSENRLNERHSIPRRRRPDLTSELSRSTLALLDHRTRIDRRVWTHVARTTFRDVDPAAVLTASWEMSLTRYAAAIHEPEQLRPVRRTVEALYDARARLRPRPNQ